MAGILYYCGFSSSRRLKLNMPKDNLENKNLKEKLELTKNKIENLINKLESI